MAAVKTVIDPETWRKRQIETLKSVGRTNYLDGIKNPKADPIAEGVAAQGRYEEQMRKDVVLKRRKSELEKSSMGEWYLYSSTVGADKLVDGVVKREPKVKKFLDGWQPTLVTHVTKIRGLAKVTDTDMENRVLENLRGLKALKGKA